MASTLPADADSRAVGVTIVYDGDCPLCNSFVRHLRLRRSAGQARLVNARADMALVRSLARRGFSLDHGMVVQVDDRHYHGAAAVHVLALMSSRSDWFNRMSYLVFRSGRVAAVLYPALAAGRRVLLRLLGRPPLGPGASRTRQHNL